MRAIREHVPAVIATTAALGVVWLGITFGSRAAGGADSFGYVSEAYLWLSGRLHVGEPLAREVPWPHAEMTLTPLGYRPGLDHHSIVPTYSPGVPMLMAASILVAGTWGPYLLTPVFGGLLVFGTFELTRRIARDAVVALIAAVLMASSPAFLFNLMWPMSDIATAMLWTWSMVFLSWPGRSSAAVAGMLAAAAVVVRPNLVPLVLVGMAAAAMWSASDTPRRGVIHRVLLYAAPAVPAAVFIGILNSSLYGSPLQSGYGVTSTLYSVAHLRENLVHYVPALFSSESWAIAIAPLVLVLPSLLTMRGVDHTLPQAGAPLIAAPARALIVEFVTVVWASYLFYIPFHEWWYLRFMLPAFPWMFLLVAASLVYTTRRVAPRGATLVVAAIVTLLVVYRVSFAATHKVFTVGRDEHRYVAVAQYIDRALPPNAVFLTMQHSGTIRFYTGRQTIRYEFFSTARFPTVFDWLRERGYRPYIMLEQWEEARFVARYGDAGPIGRLQVPVVAEMIEPVRLRIYDSTPAEGSSPPPDPIPWPRTRRCVDPRGPWAQRPDD